MLCKGYKLVTNPLKREDKPLQAVIQTMWFMHLYGLTLWRSRAMARGLPVLPEVLADPVLLFLHDDPEVKHSLLSQS